MGMWYLYKQTGPSWNACLSGEPQRALHRWAFKLVREGQEETPVLLGMHDYIWQLWVVLINLPHE